MRLFRLGYHHKPGDFRELGTSYYSVPEAAHAAGKLNGERHARRVALLDTICVYVRLDYVSIRSSGSGQGRHHEQRVSETRRGACFWHGTT